MSAIYHLPERRDLAADARDAYPVQCARCGADEVWYSVHQLDTEAMRCNGPCEQYLCAGCSTDCELQTGACKDCMASVILQERIERRKMAAKAEEYANTLRQVRDLDVTWKDSDATFRMALSRVMALAMMVLISQRDGGKVGTWK